MGRDVRSSAIHLLTYLFFYLLHFTGPTVLKLQRMILDIGLHDRSVPDYSISGHMTQK